MNAKQEFKIVGTRPIRPDGLDKVTGRARYGADLNMQGQIYGHILRSPHAHANIKSIDCSKALAMEGVLAVMTGEDLAEPGNTVLGSGEGAIALKDLIPMVMSQGKVLFHAQAVAAVAATTLLWQPKRRPPLKLFTRCCPRLQICTRHSPIVPPFCIAIAFPTANPKNRPTWQQRSRCKSGSPTRLLSELMSL